MEQKSFANVAQVRNKKVLLPGVFIPAAANCVYFYIKYVVVYLNYNSI